MNSLECGGQSPVSILAIFGDVSQEYLDKENTMTSFRNVMVKDRSNDCKTQFINFSSG